MDIKTLLKEVRQLNITSHSENATLERISEELIQIRRRYYNSEEYRTEEIKLRQKENQKRIAKDKKKKEHASKVKAIIDAGVIKPGTFIKVGGTRDGDGIREVLGIDKEDGRIRLTCLKWNKVDPFYTKKLTEVDLRNRGYLQVGDLWLSKDSYITTHDVSKVQKIL